MEDRKINIIWNGKQIDSSQEVTYHIEAEWNHVNSIISAANKVIGETNKQKQNEWFDSECEAENKLKKG